MGQKVHPLGFRLGFVKTWNAKWYAGSKNYPILLKEDVSIRSGIRARLRDAAISRIDIERSTNQVTVTIHTAKPGVVIGKGGAKVEELRQVLGKTTGKAVKVNIFEIRYPELDAVLIAENVAQQLERRVSFRGAEADRPAFDEVGREGRARRRRWPPRRCGDEPPRMGARRSRSAAHHARGHRVRPGDREDDVRHDRREGLGLQG
jgi:ribosomal protein S3